jgi:hypothetical protein
VDEKKKGGERREINITNNTNSVNIEATTKRDLLGKPPSTLYPFSLLFLERFDPCFYISTNNVKGRLIYLKGDFTL